MSDVEANSIARLKEENERLIALLEANGIQWGEAPEQATWAPMPEKSRLSASDKVALFS